MDDIFKFIFLYENCDGSIKISLEFATSDPIKNKPAVVQQMAGRRTDDKPLSVLTMVRFNDHWQILNISYNRKGHAVSRSKFLWF